MSLEFQGVCVSLGGHDILKDVSLTAQDGQVTGIVGPNGSGKSTLLKSLFGIVPMRHGSVLLNGKDSRAFSRKQLSGAVGYVSQETAGVFDFTVREVVEMGLFAHGKVGRGGRAIVQNALAELTIEHLSERSMLTLSGGEKKMVFLARTVAQGVDTVVLDEPTNHLDIRHQLFIMNYLRRSHKTVAVVLHDLSWAAHFCDIVYVMCGGTCLTYGPPEVVLTREIIRKAFDVDGEAVREANGHVIFKLDMK